ncbi:hypothetical protein L202_04739 [Cryptococcus amylolentus CBS 6039]|uniref:RRM domain-containing protein n=2 Tax=Cryptococcus amylolentus TaxID=104669 RepID=A0A1E3HMK0_9TREE|nr:hypothetical protein L202_04739 [Cryptococcus amylolentus CBS 6039]ODN77570.1 hypothetical protein L202_04739 [Cryptococcus amylolentus CBS 6039]ODO05607.1 hypothetical protein I350_04665 [Cryptococcus amylolentus CBS 6273]
MSYNYSNPFQGYQDRPALPQRPYEARPGLGKSQIKVFFTGLPEGLSDRDLLAVLKEDLNLPSTTRVFNAYQPDGFDLGAAIVCVDTVEDAERIRSWYNGKVINHRYTLSVHHVLTHDKKYPSALIEKLHQSSDSKPIITRTPVTPVTPTSNHPIPPKAVAYHQAGQSNGFPTPRVNGHANGNTYGYSPSLQPRAQAQRSRPVPPRPHSANSLTSRIAKAGPSRNRVQPQNGGGKGIAQQQETDPAPGLSLLKRISGGPGSKKSHQQLLLEQQEQNFARSQSQPQPQSQSQNRPSQPRRAHQTRAQRTMTSLRTPQQSSRAKVQRAKERLVNDGMEVDQEVATGNGSGVPARGQEAGQKKKPKSKGKPKERTGEQNQQVPVESKTQEVLDQEMEIWRRGWRFSTGDGNRGNGN